MASIRGLQYFASSGGHSECVKILLKAGAQIEIKDDSGWSPLTYALYRGHIEVAELLSSNELLEADIKPQSLAIATDSSPAKPFGPQSLFGNKIKAVSELALDDIDDIPSFSLPPPIIPFRI